MRTINALLNSIQRRIRAEAAGAGIQEILITAVNCLTPVMGVPLNEFE